MLISKKKKATRISFTDKELASLKEIGLGDAVDIGEYSGPKEDLIIIEDKTKTLTGLIRALNAAARIIVLLLLAVCVYCFLSYKLVPAKVYGSSVEIGNISLVSRYAETNLGEIKQGSVILVRDSSHSDLSPVVLRFSVYEVTERKDFILRCKDENGRTANVEVSNVLYIVKKE